MHVTDQQRGVSGVELQLPGQREVRGPALLAEQVQGVPAVSERQRERGLRSSLSRCSPYYLDEPGAFDVVGQPQATDADVARGFEHRSSPSVDQPSADAQVNGAHVVSGKARARRLGHAVVAEPVAGVAADRVGDPLAVAVEGLE